MELGLMDTPNGIMKALNPDHLARAARKMGATPKNCMRSKTKPTRIEREIYLRDVLGLKRIVRDGRVDWVKDQSAKSPKLQFGQGMTNNVGTAIV